MNPVVEEQQLPQPPQPPQPHRISTSCDRHPDEHFTGFCPSCLCERLAVLDQSSSSSTAAAPARKSTSSALKSIFRPVTGNANTNSNPNSNAASERPTFRTRPGSFLPELRRTKSFSGSGGRTDGGGIFEPQRKSCDVRGRYTLWSLFNQDDEKRAGISNGNPKNPTTNTNTNNDALSASSSSSRLVVDHPREPKFNHNTSLVIELREEKEVVQEVEEEGQQLYRAKVADNCEIEEVEEPISSIPSSGNPKFSGEGEQLGEILEAVEKEEEEEEEDQEQDCVDLKPMKDHIDLHSSSQTKKPAGGTGGSGKDFKELAGSFWSAASVFSKKLRAWTRKNNGSKVGKKHNGGGGSRIAQAFGKKRNGGRSYRETQSEIADYGFGRRSCDTDPRFSIDAGRMSLDYGRMSLDAGRMSLDAGRISLDDPRYSFDEPRASWDGYLIGGGLGRASTSSFPRMPPMVSVVEDPHPHPPPISHLNHHAQPHPPPSSVPRKDSQIPLEEQFQLPRNSIHEEDQSSNVMPGNATQTKDYYSDSSSRRRKSLDRSGSIRKTAAMVVAEMDEMKSSSNGSNAKVTPAAVDSSFSHGVGVGVGGNVGRVSFSGEREMLRDSNSNSLRAGEDFYSGSFDQMGIRDNVSVIGEDRKTSSKKSRRWRSWNIWGLIIRRGSNKDDDEDSRYSSRVNGVDRSFSESWPELGRDAYGDPRVGFNRNVLRSNSSVSWRNSQNIGGGGGSELLGGSSSLRRNGLEAAGHAKKKSNEFVLERNRSARYSPTHSDNGLLRFYLTPMRGSRRGAPGKTKPAYSHAIARSVLRMY